ncbi:MAG TPA: DNA methyltransferase [Sphingomicrobium sp.]
MIFQSNQIIHGEAEAELAKLEDQCIDLIITDPPYLVGYRDRTGRTIANDRNPDGVLPSIMQMYRVLKADRYAVLFCGWSAIAQFSAAWDAAGFRAVGHIMWAKDYASSSFHTHCRHESAWLLAKRRPAKPGAPVSDVMAWTYSGNRAHPTEKAVDILSPLVGAYSKPGDIVLDPFSGSGSTAVASALAGRRYLGIDVDERYCEHARRRLAGVHRRYDRKVA